jgi:zinc transporter ZupT
VVERNGGYATSAANSGSPLLQLVTNPTLVAILAVLAAYAGLLVSFQLQDAMAYLLGVVLGALLWARLSDSSRRYVDLGRK